MGNCLWDTNLFLFVLVPWVWAEAALALRCDSDHFRTFTIQGYKCCKICPSEKARDVPCQSIQDKDCKCEATYQCHNPACDYCLRLPTCSNGQILRRRGEKQYSYECADCENGTYSDPETGLCRKWTNCMSQGLVIITSGNKTQNVRCGEYEASSMSKLSESMPAVSLAVLAAVAIFILILMTIFLHLYIWRVHRKERDTVQECASSPPLFCTQHKPLPLPYCPHPLEDTCSCQFPEEETGEKTAKEETH
ncbi:tumor necrosis factor receptor superfamily member 18 [Rhinatrema bivittatum]|uniref:tumor necrosis factor receptor superfamily member 18 n=1 Tax=Rhinatrema bivittatum TaxID=194408 RepID=UPI001125BED4|nr:tumor necrosis factor receptor superfamily member 18 [Rhinatrema bivittatum]